MTGNEGSLSLDPRYRCTFVRRIVLGTARIENNERWEVLFVPLFNLETDINGDGGGREEVAYLATGDG